VAEIGFAVVGAGNAGKVHARAIGAIPEASVRVVCDRHEERARLLAADCRAAWTADSPAAVTRDDVQVVCVCTPSGSHAEIAEAAALAGKHLAVEKPIEVTLERADRIIRAAARSGIRLTCILPFRFRNGVHETRQAVQTGRLGRLTLVTASVKWYRPQSYYTGSWRGTWALDGGGALMNQAIHTVDLLQWLGGPVSGVYGRTATLAHQMETEDTACAVVTFRSGAMGIVQAATSCWPGLPARLELHGDKGTIALEEGRVVTWDLADTTPEERERMLALEGTAASGSADPMAIGYELHRRQLADLIDAVRANRPPAVEGSEARRAVELILAVYRSAQSGLPVPL
jgi:UDP-N-acetyl-2-amino-2-deoxyglucuronate dehydrogenase